jgi:hypothetical protein
VNKPSAPYLMTTDRGVTFRVTDYDCVSGTFSCEAGPFKFKVVLHEARYFGAIQEGATRRCRPVTVAETRSFCADHQFVLDQLIGRYWTEVLGNEPINFAIHSSTE